MTSSFRLLLAATAFFVAIQLAALGIFPAAPGTGFSVRDEAGTVVITHVRPRGNAMQAGLQAGQILVTLGSTPIHHSYDVRRWMGQFAHAGSIANATVLDHGQLRHVRVTIGSVHQPGTVWWIAVISLALYYFSGYYLLRERWSHLTARWFGLAMMGIGMVDIGPLLHALWVGWMDSMALSLESLEARIIWLAPALLTSLLIPAIAFCILQFLRRQSGTERPLDWFDRFFLGMLAVDGLAEFLSSVNRTWGWIGPHMGHFQAGMNGVLFVLVLLAAVRMGRRMRGQVTQSPHTLRQYRILRTGALLSFLPALPSPFVHLFWPGTRLDRAAALAALSTGLFPILTAYAISRFRLFGLRRLMRKSLQYGLLSGGIGIVFLCLLLAVLWRAQQDAGHPAFAGDMFLLGGLVVFSRWGSPKLYRSLDRRFFREAWIAEDILSRLGSQIGHFFQLDELQRSVLAQLDSALHLEWGAFYAWSGEGVGHRREVLMRATGIELPGEIHPDKEADHLHAPLLIGSNEEDQHAGPHWAGAEVVVPLRYQEKMLGWLLLGSKRSQEPYSRRDVKLLDAIGNQLAAAIAGIQLLEEVRKRDRLQQEIAVAREVQMRLLPQYIPQIPGLEIAATYSPAREIGGDYYDAVEIAPEVIALALADVSGKGVSAALLMANLQAVVRSQMHAGDVSERLARMNNHLCRSVLPGQFVTMFYCEYDHGRRRLTYSNAGHEPPLLVRSHASGAKRIQTLTEGGTVLGLFAGVSYPAATVELEPGDLLLLYTDGVTDAVNPAGERFERERLVETVEELARQNLPAAAIVEKLRQRVAGFSAGHDLFDDLTLLALRVVK